jgi:hypothetical protein
MSIAAAGLTETHPQRQLIDPAPRLQGDKLVANHNRILPRRNTHQKEFLRYASQTAELERAEAPETAQVEKCAKQLRRGLRCGPNLRADVGDHFKKDA